MSSKFLDDEPDLLGELWNKMYALMRFLLVDDESFDQYILDFFNKSRKEIPDWFSSSHIFTPIITVQEERLKQKLDSIANLQERIQYELAEKKRRGGRDNSKSTKAANEIQNEINQLNSELQQVNNNISILSAEQREKSQVNNYDEEYSLMAQYSQQYHNLQEHIEILNTLEAKIRGKNASIAKLKANLEASKPKLREVQNSNNNLEDYRKNVLKHFDLLRSRQETMLSITAKYQQSIIDNNNAIHKLEERKCDHDQLVASYHSLEDKIKAQEKKQEDVLREMINAVELCETQNAAVQKERMSRDMYAEELARIKELIGSTSSKFDEAVAEQEEDMKNQFGTALTAIQGRIKLIDTENMQLEHDKESVMKQINTATQENSILKATRSDNGFSHFVESISALKAEIEAAFSKKEQIMTQIEQSKQEIELLKEKEEQIRMYSREDHSNILLKHQQAEMALQMQKAVLKELSEKNSRMANENQMIRNEIEQLKRVSNDALNEEIRVKEQSIAEAKVQLEEVLRTNEKSISEVEQAILGFKQNAEKWKMKEESIHNDACDRHDELDDEIEDRQQHIEELQQAVLQRRNDNQEIQARLDQDLQEYNARRQEVVAMEKRYRRGQVEIDQRVAQHMEFSRQIAKYKDLLDKLEVKTKQKKREMRAIEKE